MDTLRDGLRRTLTVALTLTAVACAGVEGEREGPASAGAAGGLVGSPAPDFKVSAVKGPGPTSLAALRGKVVVVDFWGTFCEPCKKSFPRLQSLSAKYAGRGLRVVGISEDEAEEKDKIADFADTYGAAFTIGWDADKSAARKYKPEAMPSSYVIDRSGVVRFVHVGFHDGDEVEMEREVKSLLGE